MVIHNRQLLMGSSPDAKTILRRTRLCLPSAGHQMTKLYLPQAAITTSLLHSLSTFIFTCDPPPLVSRL